MEGCRRKLEDHGWIHAAVILLSVSVLSYSPDTFTANKANKMDELLPYLLKLWDSTVRMSAIKLHRQHNM